MAISSTTSTKFDPENVYVQSRYWTIGSCPHLFFEATSGEGFSYEGKLFADSSKATQEHTFIVPATVCALLIAELEEETTYLQLIQVNGESVAIDSVLYQGETFRLNVQPGDLVRVRGFYKKTGSGQKPDPLRRNKLIYRFLSRV